jgi:RNA recognition motif-containing protein
MEPEGPINEYGIYCGNLAWDVSSEILKEYLSQIGPVESCEVFLNYDGRSKGSAIARFETKEAATKAINELNDTDFRGRLLQV